MEDDKKFGFSKWGNCLLAVFAFACTASVFASGTLPDGFTRVSGIQSAGLSGNAPYIDISTNATDAFSVTTIPPVAYKNGEPLTPRPVVRTADGSRTLVQGTDYDLSWGNNCEIGRGYVLITGKGDFADKLWGESFSILPVLPGSYKAVEYIRSSRTQYIDTGFKPDVNTRADIHFYMEEFGSWSEYAAPFGSRNANNSQFFVGAARQKVNGTPRDDWYRRFSNRSFETVSISTGKPSVVGEHHFSLNKATYTLDAYANTFSGYNTFTNSCNAYVFTVNDNNVATQFSPMKLYSLRIWDDGTLVRDFVPCVNKDGVAGLYDMTPGASKVFYANDGTGEFEAGPKLEVAKAGLSIFVR